MTSSILLSDPFLVFPEKLDETTIVEGENRRTTVNIETFCDNVLLDVFRHLDAKDLRNASLVNKRWNEIIGSSIVTMKKLELQPTTYRLNDPNDFKSNRNHQNIVIRPGQFIDWTKLADVIQLERVKTVRIRRNCVDSQFISEFLSHLPELDSLYLENVTGRIEFEQRIEIPKLCTVEVIGKHDILGHIDLRNVQEMKFTGENARTDTKAQLIERTPNLKRLTLWNCMEVLEHVNVRKIPFKLDSMEVYHINVNPNDVSVFIENFRQFLLLQSDTIHTLRFDFSMMEMEQGRDIVDDLLRIAFNKCTKLTHLDIRNLSISKLGYFYKSLSPNHSIRTLKVHWSFDGDVIDGLLTNCPDLERLETEFCYLDRYAISSISKLCKKLTHLSLYKFSGTIDAKHLRFQNLKHLSIEGEVVNFDVLLSLVAKSPVIEQIRIGLCCTTIPVPLDIFLLQPKLRKVFVNEISYDIVDDEHSRRAVRRKIAIIV